MSAPRPLIAPDAEPERRAGASAWARYGLALVTVVAATLLTFALRALLGWEHVRIVFILYFPAVLLTAMLSGRRPSFLAIALAAFAGNFFFLPPLHTFSITFEEALQTLLFVLVASMLVYLTGRSRAAERAARRSEESLAITLSSIGDAVIATDAGGRVTFINAPAERLTGWAAAEARGRPLADVFRILREETREPAESPAEKVLREGRVVGLANHTLLVSRDGRETPIDDSASPIRDRDGKTVGVVLVFHDISDRRQAESARERLAAIVDTSADAIIGKTLDGTVTSWNAAAERLYGYTPAEAVGRSISLIVPPERADEIADILARVGRGERVEHLETVRVRKDGTPVEVAVTVSPIADNRGRVVGASTIARDVSARRRHEEERARLTHLVEAERTRLTSLVGSVPGVVWEAWGEPDASSQRINFVSDYVERMLGYTVGEWLAEPNFWLKIVHPDDQERAAAEAHDIFAGERDGTSQFRWVAKDGRVVHVESQSVPVFDEGGRPVGMRGVTMDITERVRAQEERERLLASEQAARASAEASERHYRALADAMPQIVWTAREDGSADYYNRRWYEYTGLTPEQAAGWGWQHVVHPEDAEPSVRTWARSVAAGEDFQTEYRFRCVSDGQYRWHLGRAEPLRDAAGRVVKWFGTATDIHEKREAEGRVRFLAEASRLLSSSLDYETTLAELARLAVASLLADFALVDVLGEDGRIRRAAVWHRDPARVPLVERLRQYPPDPSRSYGLAVALRTGKPTVIAPLDEAFIKAVARDEQHLALLRELEGAAALTVPLEARGRTFGALNFVATAPREYTPEDISFAEELARRAALALDNALLYGRAQEANRAKDEFLATLSHELRTPLTPIIGWTHMLLGGRLGEAEAAQGMRVIDKNSQALSRLINDLLDMTSILTGKMRIERAPVALGEVLRQAAETVRPQADARRVQLELTTGGLGALNVSGDRTRLVQVFWNLLNNAVKFSPAGGRVGVACRAEGRQVVVEVADDGSGIEPGFLPHVFERFRQADMGTTRAHGGLGIGLALVKSFVEAHGGAVEASSAGEGRGSRFTVRLPALEVPGSDGRPSASAASEEAGPACATTACRVLLIEDARDTLDMLRVLFEARGYETAVCSTPEEALRVAGAGRFDIIVSDIGLPRIDGYELIKRLRSLPHLGETPAVALTGYAAPRDAEEALQAGFDAHVAKPVEPAALAEQVEQLLKRRAPRDGDGKGQ